jgi:hypothetical protein
MNTEVAKRLNVAVSQSAKAKKSTKPRKSMDFCIVCRGPKPIHRQDMTRPEFFCSDEHEEQFFREHGLPLELRFEWKPDHVASDPAIVVVSPGVFRRVVLGRRPADEELRLREIQAYAEIRRPKKGA